MTPQGFLLAELCPALTFKAFLTAVFRGPGFWLSLLLNLASAHVLKGRMGTGLIKNRDCSGDLVSYAW